MTRCILGTEEPFEGIWKKCRRKEKISELVCERIISLDGFARGQRSPAYYGYSGPDFDGWITTNTAVPHRMLIGRRTYEMLNGLPAEVRDEGWKRTTTTLRLIGDRLNRMRRESNRCEFSDARKEAGVEPGGLYVAAHRLRMPCHKL